MSRLELSLDVDLIDFSADLFIHERDPGIITVSHKFKIVLRTLYLFASLPCNISRIGCFITFLEHTHTHTQTQNYHKQILEVLAMVSAYLFLKRCVYFFCYCLHFIQCHLYHNDISISTGKQNTYLKCFSL